MKSTTRHKQVAPRVYQNGGGFHIRPLINGKRTWRKLSATSLDDAIKEASEITRLRTRAKLGLSDEPLRPTGSLDGKGTLIFMPPLLLDAATRKASKSGFASLSGYLCHLARMDVAGLKPVATDLPNELRRIANSMENQI